MAFASLDEIKNDIYVVHLEEHMWLRHITNRDEALESFKRDFDKLLEDTYKKILSNPERYLKPEHLYNGTCWHTVFSTMEVEMMLNMGMRHGDPKEKLAEFVDFYGRLMRAVYCRLCEENNICNWNKKSVLLANSMDTGFKERHNIIH